MDSGKLFRNIAGSPKRLLMSFTGVAFLGVTVAFLTKAALGKDPWTVFVEGIANVFHTSYGFAYPVVTGIFFVLVFFIDRKQIGIATVFNLFGVGTVKELAQKPLDFFFPEPLMYQRVIFFIIALVILCIASSLYMTADLGVSAYDAVAIITAKRSKFQFRWCRITTDVLCTLTGWLLGAPLLVSIGAGTIVTAFFMGPFTQWCCDHIAKPLLKDELEA